MYRSLEEGLGYIFENRKLLENALTHSSYANENRERGLPDNERLEFLGDSILGFVVADYLYRRFPEKPGRQKIRDPLDGKRSKGSRISVCFLFENEVEIRFCFWGTAFVR